MTNSYTPSDADLQKWPCRRPAVCANHMPWEKAQVEYYRGYTLLTEGAEVVVCDMGMETIERVDDIPTAKAHIDAWVNFHVR